MQQRGTARLFTIEAIFAGMHSTYWMSMCAFSGFMAVYLSYYGFSDALIGVTASAISAITIFYQLGVSSFSDRHPHIALKKIITVVYLAILALVAALALVPLPMVLMLLGYAMTGALANGMPGLYNAQIIQFVNAGLPVNLMPIALVCIVAATVLVLVMPRPEQLVDDEPIPALAMPLPKTSLKQLLGASRVMQVFLLSAVFMSAGQSNMMLFLTRVVESKGGNEGALGLAMFLQAGVEMPAMFVSPWLMRRFRARAILSFSVFSYFVKSLIILFSTGIFGVYLAMAYSLFCFGLYGITSVYFVNSIVRQNERVRAQSLITVSGALSAVISNLAAGWVVQTYGISRLNLICAIFQAIAAGLMFYCAYLHLQSEKIQRTDGPLPFPLKLS